MEIKEMTVDQLEERKAAISTEVDNDGADLDALAEEVRSINEEIETRKQAETKRVEIRDAVAAGAGHVEEVMETREETKMDVNEIRNSTEYINAYANAIRKNDRNFTECRSLLTDNTVGGVVPAPVFVGEIVADQLKASEILSRVRHMEAAGNVKVGFEISAPAAGVHDEGDDPITEEELVMGIVTLVPSTYKKYVSISDEALDTMSGEAYLRYIYDEVARGIIKARENAVVAAILAAPQTATATAPAVAKTGSAMGAIDDFVQARALLSSAASDLVIICTPAQYATYRGLQMAANYGVDPFDGLTVLFNDTVTAPIIGDLSGVLENLPKGDAVEFKYDDRTNMKADLVDILGRMPAAIAVVGNNFFAKVSA